MILRDEALRRRLRRRSGQASTSLSLSSGRAGGLEDRAERIGAARAKALAARVADGAAALGLAAEREGGTVTISGRSLGARVLREPLLRVPAELAR